MATRKTTTKETETKKTPAKKTTRVQTTSARVSPTKSTASAVKAKATSSRSKKAAPEMDMTEESASTVGMPAIVKRKLSKRTLAILATVIVLGGLVYLMGKYLIIAWVDNRPVTRIQLFKNLEERYGKDTREQLIVQELIMSEARKKNIVVTDFEIDQEIKKIEDQQGGKEQLDQILQVQGISQSEFRNLIKLQLLRTKIFGEGVTVSEDDVNKYIEQNKDSLPAATAGATQADKDKLKADVQDQLRQQQISQKFNAWLQSTLQSDRVRRS